MEGVVITNFWSPSNKSVGTPPLVTTNVWRKMSTFSSCFKNRQVIISLQYQCSWCATNMYKFWNEIRRTTAIRAECQKIPAWTVSWPDNPVVFQKKHFFLLFLLFYFRHAELSVLFHCTFSFLVMWCYLANLFLPRWKVILTFSHRAQANSTFRQRQGWNSIFGNIFPPLLDTQPCVFSTFLSCSSCQDIKMADTKI